MKLLTTGAGFVVGEFIVKRLIALRDHGIELDVVLSYKELPIRGLSNVNYITIHSFKKAAFVENLFFFIRTIGLAILNPRFFHRLASVSPHNDLKRFFWALERMDIRKAKPDVIHVQWLGMAESYSWLKVIFKKRLISSARGSQVTVYPYVKQGYKESIARSIDASDFVHCVSTSILESCVALSPDINKEKLFVNYNGVDTTFFDAGPERETIEQITLLSVGAIMWRKNFICQLIVVKQLVESGYDNVKLKIIGNGPDREGLESMIHMMKLNQFVELIEYKDTAGIRSEYRSADIYLSTSFAEGLSNSVMEAISCGLPCVAFECEGMNELIENGISGFVVPKLDTTEFANKVKWLISNPVQRHSFGKKGREKIVKEFALETHLEKMISFYERAANGIKK